jgi:hypothetical protein
MPDSTIKRRKISNGKVEVSKPKGKKAQKEPSPSPSASESESEAEEDATPEEAPDAVEDGADAPQKTFKDLVCTAIPNICIGCPTNSYSRASLMLFATHAQR